MAVDPLTYRRAVGRFTTGVTLVTTVRDGRAHGLTASSFTSVSLDPVLVLVSVDVTTRFHEQVLASGVFGVNVLAADQQAVSERFAQRGRPLADEFADLDHLIGEQTGVPLLTTAVAWFECRTQQTVLAGDHTLVVGEVLGLAVPRPADAPLLYLDGSYSTLA